jgi:hypothetical protein
VVQSQPGLVAAARRGEQEQPGGDGKSRVSHGGEM